MSNYFPIKTKTACQLKWNWSTIFLYTGGTASCHRTKNDLLTPETFDSFHNTEAKQQDRQAMLQGLWPESSCNYCRSIEEAGGFSDRHRHLTIPGQSPVELDINQTAVTVTPTILEIYFNNQCNLSCLYCTPWLSSKINQENKKFGVFEKNGVTLEPVVLNQNYDAMLQKFWAWMHDNSQQLVKFNALGGEPFYQPEFDNLLNYFENTKHPKLELSIVTNLMIAGDKLDFYIQRFKNLLARKKLKRIDITCSLDCLGKEQEYVRYGLDVDAWIQNFEKLLSQPWLTLNVNQTISVLTIKTMPELIKQIVTWKQKRFIGHYFSVVSPGPSFLDPKILGPIIFKDDFDIILNTMPTNNEQDQIARKYMYGISQHYMQSQKNQQEILKLRTFLDEKDRRRGTNWKTTFPWLVKELEHVVQ